MKYTQPLNEAEDAHYINGDPSIGQTGSIIPAGALENPQREIVNAITDAGLTPSASSNSQLAQAISAKITAASNALQTQINAKAADNAVVKLTGTQTISSVKTFTASPLVPNVTSGDNSTKAANTAFVDGVRSNIQTQIDAHTTAINGKQATVTGAATTITGSNLTASRAVISNSNGKVAVSDTTSTELSYVHGVTSAIQTQLNGKQSSITGAATTIASNNLTASRALVSNSSGKVAVSSVTGTELGYLSGVTSSVQTQINAKQSANDVSTAITNMLKSLYPVGSIYIGTQSTCPLATLISGSTWTLVAANKALWTGTGSNGNSTINAGLPNIKGRIGGLSYDNQNSIDSMTGAFYWGTEKKNGAGNGSEDRYAYFDASRSNSIYGNSTTVQPPAYVVNVWRRTK